MAGKFHIGMKKHVSITAVIGKLVATILGLYVGGTILSILGTTMVGKHSNLFEGFSLIGWTVASVVNKTDADCRVAGGETNWAGCITATSGTGILSVIGLIGIASIVLEFIQFRM